MIFKTDPRNNAQIQEYGCYWFSILWFVEQAGITTFDDPVAIQALYELFVKNGWMDPDCTIENGEAIFAYFGIKVKQLVVQGSGHLPSAFQASPGDFEVQSWTWHFVHFVPAIMGKVAWDSIEPPGSYSIKNGVCDSKRIYRPITT